MYISFLISIKVHKVHFGNVYRNFVTVCQKLCRSGSRPSLKTPDPEIFIGLFKNTGAVFSFSKLYFTLLASSLLCCSIFTLVLVGSTQCANLLFMSCCVILHGMS